MPLVGLRLRQDSSDDRIDAVIIGLALVLVLVLVMAAVTRGGTMRSRGVPGALGRPSGRAISEVGFFSPGMLSASLSWVSFPHRLLPTCRV